MMNLRPYAKKLVIDSDMSLGIGSPGYKRGKLVVTLSDQYPCALTLEGLPREDKKEEKVSKWNLAREGGWNRYTVLMEE
jgi:hypothetical protein